MPAPAPRRLAACLLPLLLFLLLVADVPAALGSDATGPGDPATPAPALAPALAGTQNGTQNGTQEDDVLIGASRHDNGDDSPDRLLGGGGDDHMLGGLGADTLPGGTASDELHDDPAEFDLAADDCEKVFRRLGPRPLAAGCWRPRSDFLAPFSDFLAPFSSQKTDDGGPGGPQTSSQATAAARDEHPKPP